MEKTIIIITGMEEFTLENLKGVTRLGELAERSGDYYWEVAPTDENLERVLQDFFDYVKSFERYGLGDDEYYDYMPDAINQVMQVAAGHSFEAFSKVLDQLRNCTFLINQYQKDEEDTIPVLLKHDAKYWYPIYVHQLVENKKMVANGTPVRDGYNNFSSND